MSRMDRVNQMIKREISTLIQEELQDPSIGFVTITKVTVTRDLKIARVNFSVLGTQEDIRKALDALNRSRGYLRKLIAERISIRYIPELEFYYDDSLAYEARLEKTFEDIRKIQRNE